MANIKNLKIKTLPAEGNDFVKPVTSPEAIQGNFPLLGAVTSTSQKDFNEQLVAYFSNIIETQINNKILDEIKKRLPDSIDASSFSELLTNVENMQTDIGNLKSTQDKLSNESNLTSFISYDFNHFPDGTEIHWNNNIADVTHNDWELIATQEELVYLTSIVKPPVSGDAYGLFTVEQAKQYFLDKYNNIGDFTTTYTFDKNNRNQVKSEDTDFKVYGSVTNGDATPNSGNKAHFETLQQVGNHVYVTWDRSNDDGLNYRFNIELKTVRPCFIWRKKVQEQEDS